jgi:GTP cyclohydrolase II
MSNNPRKTEQLTLLGVKVIGRVSAEVEVISSIAARYQLTKALEMGHSFSSDYLTKVKIKFN